MTEVIGAGLAGSEAAWALAERGVEVALIEQKPARRSPAHSSDALCELVCSNSLKSDDVFGNACGLLKEEMRRLGSLTMEAAAHTRVPAGGALAVDRNKFSAYVTQKLRQHPKIRIVCREQTSLPETGIVATGPLTDGALYAAVQAKPHGNYDFKDGTGIKEGETYYFKVEPLLWRVIGDEDGTLTILCNEIIYGMNFDSESSLWNESDIRQWLNGEFLENAFSQAQADMIAETQLNNGVTSVPVSATGSNTYVCENTSDKVWLLSYEEVQNTSYGFIGELAQGDGVVQGRDINRMKSVTDYAAACGALKIIGNSDYVGNGSWWLRSAYYGSTASELKVMDVRSDGYVGVYDSATLSAVGVAPAVRISIA